MQAIQLIDQYKRALIASELVFVAAFAAELFFLHKHGSFQPSRVAAIAILMPPLGASICFFPLCYLAWFRQPGSPAFRVFKLLFFWFIAAGVALIWLNILVASLGH
jgi:hypothetical protein